MHGLAYDATPPIAAPLRFLLTAPVFGWLAGLMLLWFGPDLLLSRWTPATLALTHLFTLGFMTQAMFGALWQLLPVVAGVSLPQPLRLARIVHLLLSAGTLSLVTGFLVMDGPWLRLAAFLLGSAMLLFLLPTAYGLRQADTTDGTSRAIRWALTGLAVTVLLGLSLLAWLGWGVPLPSVTLANLHAAWGLIGWCVLLVAGVGLSVVPMFLGTDRFPGWFEQRLGLAAGLFLLLLSIGHALAWPAVWLLQALASVGLAGMAGLFLRQIARSRRPPDITRRCWQLAWGSLLAALLAWWCGQELLVGVLLIGGFALSVITGMLYKIVPFLVWLHLTQASRRRYAVPNVKQLIPAGWMRNQVIAHGVALCLLLLAVAWPPLAHVAGLALLVSQGWLGWNLLYPVRRYRSAMAAMQAMPAAG